MKRKLQVFVSSTYLDLQEERQAAVSSILKAGHIPAGMELFTSSNQSQMDTIRRWIDESDVYMLILGGRYGSIEPTSKISYTELEYDYAVQQGKALFSVVITDEAIDQKVSIQGRKVLEVDNNNELKLFRKKVLSNISSFFNDEKDIKLCVYESLSDMAQDEKLEGWISAKEVSNNQELFDEIKLLKNENKKLIEKYTIEKEKKLEKTSNSDLNKEFKYLIETLDKTIIKIPKGADDSVTKDLETSLLDIFYSTYQNIAIGITNQSGMSDFDRFLYFNICPKLQVYELVVNKNILNVHYRVFEMTEKGNKFLQYLHLNERKKINGI